MNEPCAISGSTTNSLSAFGSSRKKSMRSSKFAIPSYWPRMTGRRLDVLGIVDRQVGAHVDIGAIGHRIVERKHGLVVGFDQRRVHRKDLVAGMDAVDELAADRAARARLPLRQLLAALLQRGAALAGPHEGIEREPLDPLRMALGKERGAQRA